MTQYQTQFTPRNIGWDERSESRQLPLRFLINDGGGTMPRHGEIPAV